MTTKTIAFIGPLPPPIGGVAAMNQAFQYLTYPNFRVLHFDTSNKKDNEDLYAKKSWKSFGKEYEKGRGLKRFLANEQPDLVHIFVTSGKAVIRDTYFLRLIYRKKIPCIVHFHSKKKGEFALKPNRLKYLGKFFNKYAAKIVLLSADHLAYFSHYFPQEKCCVIENFVDYSLFDNNIEEKSRDFLFVGRLSHEKGFFDLMTAVNQLNLKGFSFQLHVMGIPPNDTIKKEIECYIAQHHLSDFFTFHGTLMGAKKYNLFKESSCLIFPSHFENSPVVLKEAIAAKMAIIASDIEANQLILSGKENHFLHRSKDASGLADKMQQLLSSKENLLQLCHNSSLHTAYDKEIAEHKINSLMNELLN